ncbi:S8 family peptidase [Polaribacter aestuariivivens]|uniref:S8 family peptidase n=1 Tax=Polaribacter aestuariivivens TaxID=2304626 RepID=A0A5S3N708_9FLAO|nr:S8 family serine peptidase [Polaribacter aestuariivivens]TMM28656.1 S8 family peptidase [Polaribacter aestuariivivens]
MKFNSFKYLAIFTISIVMFSCSSNESDSDLNLSQGNVLKDSFEPIKGQYIVTLVEGTLEKPKFKGSKLAYETSMKQMKSEFSQKFQKLNIEQTKLKATFGYALEGFVAELSDSQLEKLRRDSRVKSIEEDYLITLAPPSGKGPKGGNDGGGSSAQETPWGITRVGGAIDGSGLTAWIIDSGVDLDHEDINVDVARSRTFVASGKDSKSADDGNGHGTHVAGTVAALDNSLGVIGVAPGANIVALKVLDSRGSGSFSWTVQALDYVAANAAAGDAVNMSLGPRSRYTDSAIDNAVLNVAGLGIKLAIAAGNSSDDAEFYSPARVNHPNVYTVSAMDINDNWASFSNYGTPVDYAAPGVAVKSTWKSGGYNTISGTSMASPHVCGLLLLGNVVSSGTVNNDPDGNSDPIASHN